MPAVLAELGFITSPGEVTKLADSSYQGKLASSIADGIDRYFGR